MTQNDILLALLDQTKVEIHIDDTITEAISVQPDPVIQPLVVKEKTVCEK